MNLRKPVAKNKKDKPVIIFKNDVEIKEFPTIKKAADWLKNYLDLDYIPFTTIMRGIIQEEQWENKDDIFRFTTDEKVRLDKLKKSIENGGSDKVLPTGYWTFFCNPKKWYLDDFILSGETEDTFAISEYHKNDFKAGQLGVIRVGHDTRTQTQLAGKPRLKRGIYAVVEILGESKLTKSTKKSYWEDESDGDKVRYRVEIRYIKRLLKTPLLLDELDLSEIEYDKYLVEGQQGSSMPLKHHTFNKVLDLIGGLDSLELEFNVSNENSKSITELEKKYYNSVPEVKERVSRYIERGKIAKEYKKRTGFKCQVCEAFNLDPYSFKKPNGEYYVETHHVIPVSKLQAGSLLTNNLITVCANHHRQLHYGNIELIQNTNNYFVFELDGEIIKIKKMINAE
ncbi:HNH endonuclease [Peribacillus frigoritolerans]|uniref:HNH endonuclease n=1 Tax=Peribacillus frigoritolerans TaxID=450367 RepID=UPI00215B161B|nr:EVE domain-containing protein [Peribacillus frigoritolerans]MCR8870531.1 EVE domain-containing protein [Peribacillus frigoritolerans]